MTEMRAYRDRYEAAATLLPATAEGLVPRDFYADAGRRIRAARQIMGLRQRHVAEALGLDPAALSRAEGGRQYLSVSKLVLFGQLMTDHTFDG